jgi:hypothetical protein
MNARVVYLVRWYLWSCFVLCFAPYVLFTAALYSALRWVSTGRWSSEIGSTLRDLWNTRPLP